MRVLQAGVQVVSGTPGEPNSQRCCIYFVVFAFSTGTDCGAVPCRAV